MYLLKVVSAEVHLLKLVRFQMVRGPGPYGGDVSEFIVRLWSSHPPRQAWDRVWDLERHTAVIPLTTVAPDPPATRLGEGAGFTGRTALGPFTFDDTMRVVMWLAPANGDRHRAVVEKTSRLLGGRIEVDVAPGASGSRVTWRQSVVLPWLPASLRFLEGVAARLAAPGYRLALRRLLA